MVDRAAGPFEIVEILGEGSFGTVCVARYVKDGRRHKVALKILKGAYTKNEKILNRTRDEATLLRYISHPNIVRVHELTMIHGRPVVVMELVEGVSLDHLLLRFKTGVPASVAIEVIRQTLIALHVAFSEARGPDHKPLRVIHRDIKPSNMLLSTRGELKVADFGIAKGEFSGREAKTESVVLGSRPYMAPERLDGVDDHPSVDVYSCGMSLYELLTGRTMGLSINPVTHEQAMNRQLGYLKVPGMSEVGVEDLRGIIRRMCAYDRDYRPSALEAARELEQCFYAIDNQARVPLDEFCRTTVLPIYESRPRTKPEEAVQDESESDFIREVTGQIRSSTISQAQPATWLAQVMLLGLLALILILLPLAIYKRFWSTPADSVAVAQPEALQAQPQPAPGAQPATAASSLDQATPPAEPAAAPPPETRDTPSPVARAASSAARAAPSETVEPPAPIEPVEPVEPTETVRVEVHPPPGAQITIDATQIRIARTVAVPPGPHTARVDFSDGSALFCAFYAVDQGIVRLVDSPEGRSLYVSGSPSEPCVIASP